MTATTAPAGHLTKREREVMQLMADGHRDPQIAAQLQIALGTVRAHIRQVRKKLGVKNRTHAVAILWRQRIIT